MSECYNFSASMTGSTNMGPLQPQENSSPLPSQPSSFERPPIALANNSARRDRSLSRRKMTPIPPNSQQIQLTPLWEHVVRTRRFPPEIDTRLTFIEISERLRDPEWEVRQHALRVLMDVLPTLNADVVDKVMQPVVPELINNLGHPAPAVRKGALDTLRVYLVHSENRDEMIKAILQDGLNRSEGRDTYQTNVITGVILSAPSILFPSAKSFRPTVQVLKETTTALASRLGQVPHQEAVVKSLMKIRGIVGPEEFDGYLADHDESLRRNIEILSKVYNIKPSRRAQSRNSFDESVKDKSDGRIGNDDDLCLDRTWDSDSDTSGIVEEEDEAVNGSNGGGMPGARVVLETEIKFNEETAITMTILEEKDDDEDDDETDNDEDNDDDEQDDESGTDVRNEAEIVEVANNSANEKRKTPRRVHFGGEIVKLRTPDSDDTETTEVVSQKTRIPLPVSPATKMPEERHRQRPSSQPCSPHLGKRRVRRASRSASNSPKREFHTHSADLSPTKGILTRTSSPIPIAGVQKDVDEDAGLKNESETVEKEENKSTEADLPTDEKKEDQDPSNVPEVEVLKKVQLPASAEIKTTDDSTKDASPTLPVSENNEQAGSESSSRTSRRKSESSQVQTASAKLVDEKSSARASRGSARGKGRNFDAFPRQERNYILMELSSPERKAFKEKADESEAKATLGLAGLPKSVTRQSDANGSSSSSSFDSQNRERDDTLPVTANSSNASVDESIVSERVEGYRDGSQASPPTGGERPMICASVASGADRSTGTVEAKIDSSRNHGSARSAVDDRGKESQGGRTSIRTNRDKENEASVEGSRSVTCSSSEGESNPQEPSWEELGLVGQDVLDDLHNKDDWRARVRGLERVASALRTSSALIAIEPRLGSLLHAVLGCERSCRVAAAGLAVAKVVVAGVTEDALKRRLPQLAWGLARQGGPNAAQLARIAMLRLRPALFLEQLLQPQCLGAKNAKTRENTLQLLIFSLVTFPSTEFKVQTVAHKVASMVADRRRRVRQAALDTLAVLAQIYESEEVLKAGKKAAAGRHDKEAMICAIRARLSRKSLPLVSADGLVVYGLQISPAVQIATGPDVDWIVAGSGSVSPGTGRTRGQIIATTAKSERGRLARNETAKHRDNPWTERANLVALGVGLRSDGEQPMAWQIVPDQHEDEPQCSDNVHPSNDGHIDPEIHNGRYTESSSRLEDQLQMYHGHESELANYQEMIESNLEHRTNSRSMQRSREKNHKGINTFSQEVGSHESRIPILFLRERLSDTNSVDHQIPYTRNRTVNTDFGMRRRKSKDFDAHCNAVNSREERDGSYTTWLQRRKRMQQDTPVESTGNQSFEPHYGNYRSMSRSRNERFALDDRSPLRSESHASRSPSSFAEERQRTLFRNPPQQGYSTFETYGMVSQRYRRMGEGQSIRALSTAPDPLAGNYQQYQDIHVPGTQMTMEHMTRDASSQMASIEQVSSHAQTTGGFISRKRTESPFRRRLRSLSPSQLYHQRHFIRFDSNESHAVSMYAIDKAAVNEEEYNERNRQHYSSQEDAYQIHSVNKERTEYQGEIQVKSANSVLDLSRSNRQQKAVQSAICQRSYGNNSRSSTPQSRDVDKAFDVITETASSQDHDTVDSYIIPLGTPKLEPTVGSANTSTEEDTAKEWSSEEEVKVKSRLGHMVDDVFGSIEENDNESVDSGDLMIESDEMTERRRRASSIISSERIFSNEPLEDSTESVHSNQSSNNDVQSISSAKMLDSPKVESLNSDDSPELDSKSVGTPDSPVQIPLSSRSPVKSLSPEDETSSNSIEERIDSSNQQNDNASVQSPDIESRRESIRRNSPAIVIASRPHSTEANSIAETSENVESDVTQTITDSTQISTEESSTIDAAEAETTRELAFSMIPLVADGLAILNNQDSGSETNAEPGILKIEPTTPVATNDSQRKMQSKVPRSTARFRANSLKSSSDQSTERNASKPKPVVQQCFTQLESKDWEVTLKGLKALSQLTKQHPEYLDACAAGTIGRLLSRHIKSLRSQVSRAACLASGDIFSSQIRCVDQELDDIASSLLHRTADTNRFLRADSNAALDLMAEHLPPQKTIGIIVHRGANHQNAIVRAATARLLSNIVERVGPDQAMTLPRDVRDKLLNTGARLLIDGSLDARNHAKKMFRRLTICEGFQRALVDAVPETTLRHIDKTLKSL